MRAPLQLHHTTLRRSLLIVLVSALAACGQPTAAPPPVAAPTTTAAPRPTTPPRPTASPVPTTAPTSAPTSAPPRPTAEALTAERRQAMELSAEGLRRERFFADLEGATARYSAAIAADPTYAEAWLQRAIVATRFKPARDETADLARGMALQPPAHVADYYRGRLAVTYADKLTFFNRSIAAVPSYATAWLMRGITHYLFNSYAEAERDLTQALQRDPTLAEAWHFRAGIYAAYGRSEDALAAYDQTLALEPTYPMAQAGRGRLRATALGDPKGGVADLEAAVKRVPMHASIWCDLGQARWQGGDADGALADFARAITVDPSYGCTYYQRAIVLLAIGQPDAALADANRAMASGATSDILLLRSQIYAELGDRDAALRDVEMVIAQQLQQRQPLPQSYEQRGNVRLALGLDAKALEDFKTAIAFYKRYGKEEQAAALMARLEELGLSLSA
jgi:tetratricopeptide (TPR) repeat protein